MKTQYSLIISQLLVISAVSIFAKVLRNEDGSFNADFFQAAVDKRQPSILAMFKSTKINDCYYKCVQHFECEAINHNEKEAVCELTDYRYDDVTTLVEGPGFTYYDSSDSCSDNPCFAFADCTNIDEFPGFHCKCKKGYTGLRCDKVITKKQDMSTPSTDLVVTTKQNVKSTASAVTTTTKTTTTTATTATTTTTTATSKTTTTTARTTTEVATTTTAASPKSELSLMVIQSAELLLDTEDQITVPLKCFGKEYIIDFYYYKVKTNLQNTRNLIKVSDSNKREILAFLVKNNKLLVRHATGFKSNVIVVDMKNYVRIRIKQVQGKNGKYTFSFYMNGNKEMYKKDLASADIYFNAVLSVSGYSFKGYIKDLSLFHTQIFFQETKKLYWPKSFSWLIFGDFNSIHQILQFSTNFASRFLKKLVYIIERCRVQLWNNLDELFLKLKNCPSPQNEDNFMFQK